jgi:hypothetical protein
MDIEEKAAVERLVNALGRIEVAILLAALAQPTQLGGSIDAHKLSDEALKRLEQIR